jgi:hypothetical protein
MRWAVAAMALLLCLLAVQAGAGILNAPSFVWNEIRLARSVALLHGFSLYPDRNATGPVIGTLHTPVSHCLYLTVAGFHSPTYALLAGSLLSLLLIFVPLGWVLLRASEGTRDRLFGSTATFLFCGFLIMQAPGTFHTASMIHADAAALAFATLACGVFCNPRRPITVPQAWLAGVGCALAVGSKQTMAPIVLAIALFLGVSAGARVLAHFGAAVLVGGAVLLGAILALVPAQAFLFNTVAMAAHRPLKQGYIEVLVMLYRAGKQAGLRLRSPRQRWFPVRSRRSLRSARTLIIWDWYSISCLSRRAWQLGST